MQSIALKAIFGLESLEGAAASRKESILSDSAHPDLPVPATGGARQGMDNPHNAGVTPQREATEFQPSWLGDTPGASALGTRQRLFFGATPPGEGRSLNAGNSFLSSSQPGTSVDHDAVLVRCRDTITKLHHDLEYEHDAREQIQARMEAAEAKLQVTLAELEHERSARAQEVAELRARLGSLEKLHEQERLDFVQRAMAEASKRDLEVSEKDRRIEELRAALKEAIERATAGVPPHSGRTRDQSGDGRPQQQQQQQQHQQQQQAPEQRRPWEPLVNPFEGSYRPLQVPEKPSSWQDYAHTPASPLTAASVWERSLESLQPLKLSTRDGAAVANAEAASHAHTVAATAATTADTPPLGTPAEQQLPHHLPGAAAGAGAKEGDKQEAVVGSAAAGAGYDAVAAAAASAAPAALPKVGFCAAAAAPAAAAAVPETAQYEAAHPVYPHPASIMAGCLQQSLPDGGAYFAAQVALLRHNHEEHIARLHRKIQRRDDRESKLKTVLEKEADRLLRLAGFAHPHLGNLAQSPSPEHSDQDRHGLYTRSHSSPLLAGPSSRPLQPQNPHQQQQRQQHSLHHSRKPEQIHHGGASLTLKHGPQHHLHQLHDHLQQHQQRVSQLRQQHPFWADESIASILGGGTGRGGDGGGGGVGGGGLPRKPCGGEAWWFEDFDTSGFRRR